jgi:hypothetical protein
VLATARWIRHRSAALFAADRSEARVKVLINAEEMAIGAHIDEFGRARGDAVPARLAAMPFVVPGSQEARLRPLTLYGRQTMGVKCGQCKAGRGAGQLGDGSLAPLHAARNTCAKWHLGRNR